MKPGRVYEALAPDAEHQNNERRVLLVVFQVESRHRKKIKKTFSKT
jgi:hypothetical protein